jgi:hypothetical protein
MYIYHDPLSLHKSSSALFFRTGEKSRRLTPQSRGFTGRIKHRTVPCRAYVRSTHQRRRAAGARPSGWNTLRLRGLTGRLECQEGGGGGREPSQPLIRVVLRADERQQEVLSARVDARRTPASSVSNSPLAPGKKRGLTESRCLARQPCERFSWRAAVASDMRRDRRSRRSAPLHRPGRAKLICCQSVRHAGTTFGRCSLQRTRVQRRRRSILR